MILKRSVLHTLMFLLVCIYAAKVLVVMSYLDSSKEGLMGQARPNADKTIGSKGADPIANPGVRSILQENRKFVVVENSDLVKDDLKQDTDPKREADVAAGVKGGEREDAKEGDDFAGMNADLFAEVLRQQYDHSTKCSDESLFLLILIASHPENLNFRMTIRETWANAPDAETQGVLAMFTMGRPSDRPELEKTIAEENDRYDDIIQGNFLENFRNSSLKTLSGLKWVTSHCSSAKFVFMGDDHMYLNLDKLVKSLRAIRGQEGNHGMWRGRVRTSSKAVREESSKYYVSERVFDRPVYPPFCTLDAGFVLSMPAVHELYRESFDRSILPFGDVYIGIVADELKWSIIEDDLFSFKDYGGDTCELSKFVTLRGFNIPENIRDAFDKLHNETFLRECPDPDLNLVLSIEANNKPYIESVLKMVHDHPRFCYDELGRPKQIFMLNLISSLPRHFESRQAIRKTWGGQEDVNGERIKTLFVMGLTQQDTEEIQREVQKEDDEYGDIIQAGFRESFHNLTLKVVLGLKWVSENCRHATYIYKGDDDMFVNFPNIINFLKKERSSGKAMTKFFLGSVLFRSVRINRKDSKYFVNEKFYSGRYFPPYCSGGGYILSSDTMGPMYEQALNTTFIPIDDAYQGILAKKVGIVPIYNGGFKNWGEKSDSCSLRKEDLMTIHGYKDPNSMYAVWRNFTDLSVQCDDR